MITSLPAVQAHCSRIRRYACMSRKTLYWEKRHANRRYRRALNNVTRTICKNPELWWSECFNAPSLSTWDLW